MAAQAAIEGRFLGGRPPYGYQLINVGPHANPAKAATGQQLRQLAPDPMVASVVQRIFDQFCAGKGLHSIAGELNANGILSPSGHDPERNQPRESGKGKWAKSAVRAILVNPRYTGFQVWNKQRKDEVLLNVEDVALGHQTKMRWNDETDWVWPEHPMHEALISRDQFELAQTLFDRNKRATMRTPAAGREYLLAGLVHCGICNRRMQGQWNHNQAYYRCRYRDDYAVDEATHPKSIYAKEKALLPGLDMWLTSLFDDDHIDDTCRVLAGISEADAGAAEREAALRDAIRTCDKKLDKYRNLLDEDGEVAIAAKWITETQKERRALEAQLGRQIPGGKMTTEQVKALVTALRDIVAVLADADPVARAAVYNDFGVALTYTPDGTVGVEAHPRGVQVRVGGGTCTVTPRAFRFGRYEATGG